MVMLVGVLAQPAGQAAALAWLARWQVGRPLDALRPPVPVASRLQGLPAADLLVECAAMAPSSRMCCRRWPAPPPA